MFKSQFYRTEGTGFPAGPETIGGGEVGVVAEGETATTKI